MWKLVFTLLLLALIWKFYPAISQIDIKQVEKNTSNTVHSEKTIYGVTSGREREKKEMQDAMNKY